MDRISELPTFIIHHIMSYLSAKEVARTSVLSKIWYQLCISFPFLVFDQTYFFPADMGLDSEGFSALKQTEKKFTEFVDASLCRFCKFKFCMQELKLFLVFLDDKGTASLADKWIGHAVDNGVKDLELKFAFIEEEEEVAVSEYILPQTIFSANLMTTLKLTSCMMEQPSDTLRLDSLKKLTLYLVHIDDQMVQKLTSECPLLEDLSISNCWGLKHLCVSKAQKLKILAILLFYKIEIVEIVVPSLQQLTLLLHFGERRPPVIKVARSPHLMKLLLTSLLFMNEEFDQFISKFPLLEDLTVRFCFFPERIKISSNQLKNLQFYRCENLKAIVADTPNLLSFTFSYEFNLIPTISMNALCPWKVSFLCKGNLDTHWYLQLRKFLRVAKQIEQLKLSLDSCKVSFNLDELRENSRSLPLQAGNLELYADVPVPIIRL